MAIVDELVSILGFELRGTEKLQQFESGMDRAKSAARNFATVAVGAFAAVAGAMTTAAVVLAKGAITTGAEFEKLETTLTTIEGSSEKAKASLAWVQKFAKQTPYDLNQVAESFVRLRAYGLDPMGGLLEAVGDASSALAKPLMSGVEAVADAVQGENERLKEFGITAEKTGNKITYNWQQNGQQMKRTVNKDGIEIQKALTEIFQQRFGGAMRDGAKNWNNMVSNLGDVWTNFQKKIADAGFFDYMRSRLSALMNQLDELDANGTLDRWAKALSDSFIWIASGIDAVAQRVLKHGKFIADWIASLDPSTVKAIGAAFAIAAAWLFPMAWALGVAAAALEDFLSYLQGDQSVFGDFVQWIKDLTGASDTLAISLASVAAALGLIVAMRARAILTALGGLVVGGSAGGAAGATTAGAATAGAATAGAAAGAATAGAAAGTGTAAAAGLTLRALLGRIAPFLLLSGDTAGNKYLDADAAERERMRNEANERTRVRNINSGIATSKAGIAERERDTSGVNTGRRLGGWAGRRAGVEQIQNDASPVINDSRQDNRNQSVTANVTVNQSVTQAVDAPAAAAQATGNAVGQAATQQATRLATEPAL